MSLQKFIEYANTHYNSAPCSPIAPSIDELHAVAALLTQEARKRQLAAAEAGPSVFSYVSMLEQARKELEKLGVPVNE